MKRTLLALLLALTTLTTANGCAGARTPILHPIEKSDIFMIPVGATIHIAAGTKVYNAKGKVVTEWKEDTILPAEKDGWFLSNLYFKEVLKARIDH